MAALAALADAQLVALWEPSSEPPQQRLEPLLAAAGAGDALDRDTLGARNIRLLRLHAALTPAPLEARLRCARCATENLFTVPAAEIAACPVPDPADRVELRLGRRRLVFRLPDMGDLKAAAGLSGDRAAPHIAARCLVEGAANEPLAPALLARLADQWEKRDPAGSIDIDLECAECAAPLRARVDIAELVAAAVDRRVDRLYREIDVLARAYGWGEQEILALPVARRRRYLALIAARADAARPAAAPAALRG